MIVSIFILGLIGVLANKVEENAKLKKVIEQNEEGGEHDNCSHK